MQKRLSILVSIAAFWVLCFVSTVSQAQNYPGGRSGEHSTGMVMQRQWQAVEAALKTKDYDQVSKAVAALNRVKRLNGFLNADLYALDILSEAENFFVSGNQSAASIYLDLAHQISGSSLSFGLKSLPLVYQIQGLVKGNERLFDLMTRSLTEPLTLIKTAAAMTEHLLSALSVAVVLILVFVLLFNRPRIFEYVARFLPAKLAPKLVPLITVIMLVVPYSFGILTGLIVSAIIYNLALGRGRFLVLIATLTCFAWPLLLPMAKRIELGGAAPLVRHYIASNQHSYSSDRISILTNQRSVATGNQVDAYLDFALAQLVRADGDLTKAASYLQRAESGGVVKGLIAGERAAIAFAKGDLKAASALYDQAQEELGLSAELLLNQAVIAKQSEDFARFGTLFEQARLQYPQQTQQLWDVAGSEKVKFNQSLALPVSFKNLKETFSVPQDRLSQATSDSFLKVFLSGNLSYIWLACSLTAISALYALVKPGKHLLSYRDPHATLPVIITLILWALPGRHILFKGKPVLAIALVFISLLGLLPFWFIQVSGLNTNTFTLLPFLLLVTWSIAMGLGWAVSQIVRR
jgi:hypothetical protein